MVVPPQSLSRLPHWLKKSKTDLVNYFALPGAIFLGSKALLLSFFKKSPVSFFVLVLGRRMGGAGGPTRPKNFDRHLWPAAALYKLLFERAQSLIVASVLD